MPVSVLIVTPTTAFGENIRQALIEDGGYRPVLVNEAQEAIRYARKRPFEVVILDTDLRESPLADLEFALRQTSPTMRLVVIPRKGDGQLAGLTPDLFLTKPFYMPDFLEKLDEILSPIPVHVSEKIRSELFSSGHPATKRNRAAGDKEVPPWLEDVARAAQRLTRLSLETSAQASLITRGDQLWAYAGHLPQEAAAELAGAVLKDYDWSVGGHGTGLSSDLARFVHLVSTDYDYMLYTTGLGDQMVLAMAFDAKMPFSQMRAQTGNLARALASPPSLEQHNPAFMDDEPDVEKTADVWIPEPKVNERLDERLSQPFMDQEDILPASPSTSQAQGRGLREQASSEIDALFSQAKTRPIIGPKALSKSATGATRQTARPSLEAGDQAEAAFTENVSDESGPNISELAITTSTWHRLSYALVLLPRMPQHFLTGDLSDQLSGTLRRLSLAFGWRLEHLAVRPEYLLLIVTLPPALPPETMVTDLKKYTSEWIFDDFPRLGRENPSGDFWAPGYLLITATQPPAKQVLRTFIDQTRRAQGIPSRK